MAEGGRRRRRRRGRAEEPEGVTPGGEDAPELGESLDAPELGDALDAAQDRGLEDVEDEYGPEITTVLERLPRANDEDDARRIIHAVLAEWFEGVDIGPEERYRELAADVWSAWRAHATGGR